ncbi:cellulase/cellobiase CelA1 [Micromonospora luteifusca]|uniref:Glucanase n=1 Tax=Micromonospora luteifusca TaxID=709860 RepID=A0ABS2LMI0_9ACTN|nr:glycoside hydrolase family 6 protein [Micromonospora luteifusca]MBM7489355.1 cellulase/cellobiase CelA1 [Micromonospora luteifusca]
MTMSGRGRVPARVRPVLATAVSVLVVGVLAGGGPAQAADPPPRVDNPYVGAQVYVNPEWADRAAAEPGGDTVAGQPTAVWLDTFVEPNSLPNLVANTGSRYTATPACDEVQARGTYQQGIGYALARLGTVPNVYAYLDISHHGEVGWPEDSAPLTALLLEAASTAGSTVANVHGFVANTANYSVLREEYFRADDVVNGQPVYQSRWVDWNPFVDEVPYAQHLRELLTGAGFSPEVGVVVDTSRNGWGGPARPAGPATAGDVNTYVDGSRIDRRARVGNWCNQKGSGLGQRPAVEPEPGIDAYAWVKPPGESDGASGTPNSGQPYEPLCDPYYLPPRGSSYDTGAMPDAPPFGEWFPAHFRQLLANAWPPV